MTTALGSQVDGSHYVDRKIQPLELTYILAESPCFCKLSKYLVRDKGSRIINLDKAIHIVGLSEELKSYSIYNPPKLSEESLLILFRLYDPDPQVQQALLLYSDGLYSDCIGEIESIKERVLYEEQANAVTNDEATPPIYVPRS